MSDKLISDNLVAAAETVFKEPGVIERLCRELKNSSAPERRVLTVEESPWLLLLLRWYGLPDVVVEALAYRLNRVGADGSLLLDQAVLNKLGVAGPRRRKQQDKFYQSAALAAHHFRYEQTETGWRTKGISQTRLAKEVGVSPATIREWRQDPEWVFGFFALVGRKIAGHDTAEQ